MYTKNLKFKTKEGEKTYIVSWPNVDQFLQIESLKTTLAAGQYNSLIVARSRTANLALDLIDAFSTFTTLLPQIIKDGILPSDFNKITPPEMASLVIVYKTQYYPWFEGIMKDIESQVAAAQKALEDEIGDE